MCALYIPILQVIVVVWLDGAETSIRICAGSNRSIFRPFNQITQRPCEHCQRYALDSTPHRTSGTGAERVSSTILICVLNTESQFHRFTNPTQQIICSRGYYLIQKDRPMSTLTTFLERKAESRTTRLGLSQLLETARWSTLQTVHMIQTTPYNLQRWLEAGSNSDYRRTYTQAYIIQRDQLSLSSLPPATNARPVPSCPAFAVPESHVSTLFKSNATPIIERGGDLGPTTPHQRLALRRHRRRRGPDRDKRRSRFGEDLDVWAR
ncbi:hypothetical protein BDM02DRAFT_604582 [Thelephora ganbajun]|uniref:Uncharacterized protein n=2 Tax=Thelephora ganbajun TaxID=370292 RepID=A0ACB6YXP6_THEGA|nr:hypothetical protein BDM02DRAFT_2476815 [Thelephora ganbajun]KAF9645266.1 hypothetical protein BDM02DRAFT_604582 [Thelephora ganbajun]